jgi:hypothetical protein
MQPEDLKTYSEFGRALWFDPTESRRVAVETLAAASLLDMSAERILEKAASGMISRAHKLSPNPKALVHPFFRLFPEERVILVALHQGRWSYARLARLLGETPDSIERLAWQARMQLASGLAAIGSARFAVYPSGAGGGINCPEYDAERPWTQRFLDEQIPAGQERLFLQSHLLSCRSCSQALARCRDLYYHVTRVVAELTAQPNPSGASVGELERVWIRTRVLTSPANPMLQAWLQVLARPDVQWIALVCILMGLGWYLKR